MAAPPGTSPSKISALASAIASTERKKPRCTGATVVMMAICGLISRVSALELAGMVHAGLEHAEARVLPHVGERERNAPMIVVRLERHMHGA